MSQIASKPKTVRLVTRHDLGRLFFLDASEGRVLSAKPDGSDLKTILRGRW